MKTARKYLAIALAFLLSVLSVPANANESAVPTRALHGDVVIDTDPEGGYEGDYVVIYNPALSSTFGMTGNMSGKIITSVNTYTPTNGSPMLPGGEAEYVSDSIVTEEDREFFLKGGLRAVRDTVDYPVGSTKTFFVGGHNPDNNNEYIEFKVLYIGEHCRIWTTTGGGPNNNYYPLDEIDGSYAELCANSFDEKFDVMLSAYGDYADLNGDGKVNIIFYNIKEKQYSGLFVANNLTKDGLPTIQIDTYPTVTNGTASSIDVSYSIMEHEFQHLINYSHTGGMVNWLNESLSTSAEVLCFPRSISARIREWTGNYYAGSDMLEAEYDPYSSAHCGKGIVYWQNEGKSYGLGMLFSQFLYTRTGSTDIYKELIDNYNESGDSSGSTFVASRLGMSPVEMWTEFIYCVTINSPSAGYGFAVPDNYDPADNNGIENPYEMLCPVIYTSTRSIYIYSYGGFITVKPVGGAYVPPSDASPMLRYVGIKIVHPQPSGDADGNGTVEATDALLILRYYMSLLDSGINVEACDVNGDGKVDAIDALIVLRKAMGIT